MSSAFLEQWSCVKIWPGHRTGMFSSLKGTDFIALSVTFSLITSSSPKEWWGRGLCQRWESAQCRGLFSPAGLLSWARRGEEQGQRKRLWRDPRNIISHRQLLRASWGVPGTVFLLAAASHRPHTGPTHSLHRPPFKHYLGDNKFLSLISALGSAALLKAAWSRTDQLSKPLPARNLLPKIAAELWGIFIAATQAFSVLKDWKENFNMLVWV